MDPSAPRARPPAAAEDLVDEALIAAIPGSSLSESNALAAEAGRRQLHAAVPALETLCRRFAGFGVDHRVPEQVAALNALVMIDGRDAADAVARLIVRGAVQGPALSVAVGVAARLRSRLPVEVLRSLLRHADPGVRADACRCARRSPELISLTVDLLDDLDRVVARSAACALGQMGRTEARPMLLSLLREEPSEEVIEAVSSIADEDCVVLLGKIARSAPELSDAALDALEGMDHPRAGAIATAIRQRLPR